MSRPKNTRGFTLIEILVALFIFTIVSFILTGALHRIMTSQSVLEKNAARLSQLQMAFLLLTHDMEQTINRSIMTAQNEPEGFIGDATTVTFTHAGLPNPFGQITRSTLQRTQYQLGNETLYRNTWPTLDQTAKTAFSKRPILDNITDLQFAYLDSANHFQKIWPPQGQAPTSLPKAIRISLTLKNWGKITQIYLIPGQLIDKTN